MQSGGNNELARVLLTLRPGFMAPLLDRAIKSEGFPPAGRRSCRVLDAKYTPRVSCFVLYEFDGRPVLGVLDLNRSPTGKRVTDVDALGMNLFPFPMDPRLPGLASATGEDFWYRTLNDLATEILGEPARILRCSVQLVRYRPMRRCTLRVAVRWRDASRQSRSGLFYAKLYHDTGKARNVFRNTKALAHVARPSSAGMSLAKPLAFVPEPAMVLQRGVDGVALDSLLRSSLHTSTVGPKAMSGVMRAAGSLAVLHATPFQATPRRSIQRELERMRERAAGVQLVDARLAATMLGLADALSERFRGLEQGRTESLIHGDCKPSQFLIGPTGLSVLDFDHCGISDPAEDVGTFLASLRQLGVRAAAGGNRKSDHLVTSLGSAFLEAYSERGEGDLRPLSQRARCYEALALWRKAYRSFQRHPRSYLPHPLLSAAQGVLETTGRSVSSG